MYHEIGIQRLSENQLSKLRNGHSVRIKLGNHHKIALSVQQLKKLHKAAQKNAATTISFDPYQMEKHGAGIFGDIAKKAKAFIQKHHLQNVINPIINHARNMGHKGVSKISGYAHSKVNELQPIDGGGPISDALNVVGNVGGPIGAASKVASTFASMFGFGARKHYTAPIKRAPKRTTTRRKVGKGFLGDLAKAGAKAVAKKGIEVGSEYLQNKVSGAAVISKSRRIVGRKAVASRKKKTSGGNGGALYPAGVGGAMYPAGCGVSPLADAARQFREQRQSKRPAGGAMYPAGGACGAGYGVNSLADTFFHM